MRRGHRWLRRGLAVASDAAGRAVDRLLEPPPTWGHPGGGRTAVVPARSTLARPLRRPVEVVFLFGDERRHGAVELGATVLEAAACLAVPVDSVCGGSCSCGTCRVQVVSGGDRLSAREDMEAGVLGPAVGLRLACQTRVLGPITVRVGR